MNDGRFSTFERIGALYDSRCPDCDHDAHATADCPKRYMKEIRHTFDSCAARDLFIETHYPMRKGLAAPGTYRVSGGILNVFLHTVTFCRNRRRAS